MLHLPRVILLNIIMTHLIKVLVCANKIILIHYIVYLSSIKVSLFFFFPEIIETTEGQTRLLILFKCVPTLEETSTSVVKDDPDYSDIVKVESNYDIVEDSASDQPAYSDINMFETLEPAYLGLDGVTNWYKHPPFKHHNLTKKCNIINMLPGPLRKAEGVKDIKEGWELFFSDTMIEKIVEFTNVKILRAEKNYARNQDARQTDIVEMKSFLGLLYLLGVNRTRHQSIADIWKTDGTGIEIFRLVMGMKRFRFLMQMICFCDVSDPDMKEKQKLDKLNPIREIFDQFVNHCISYYSLSSYVTVGEIMVPFRGSCSFKKQEKRNLKLWACTDAETYYVSNLEVDVGEQDEGPYHVSNKPKEVVKRLINHLAGTGRNVTCSSRYTSIPLSKDLLNMGLTLVGTLKKDDPQLPGFLIQESSDRPVKNSIFGFSEHSTIVSYKSSKNNYVLLLSTMHDDDCIDLESGQENKPAILTLFNKTHLAVDMSYVLQKKYSVSRISKKWPLKLFFSLLNIGAINSYVIYKANTLNSLPRKDYLTLLAKSLMYDQARRRAMFLNIPAFIKCRICDIFNIPRIPKVHEEEDMVQLRCAYCPSRKNRKTKTRCVQCVRPICREHTTTTCRSCSGLELDKED